MKRIILFCLSIGSFLLQGCSDMLDTTPYNQISSGNMWTTEELADKGVAGIYNVLYNSDLSVIDPSKSTFTGLNRPGIEGMGFCTTVYLSCPLLTSTAPSAGNAWVSLEWKFGYEGIHRCNDAIANLRKAGLTEEKLERLTCESRFMRAFFYYRLNMLFQGVPVYLEPINSSQATRGKSTADEVWQVCLDDLTYCIESTGLANNTLTSNYGRPSKGAAYALRGMVYLWKKQYDLAIKDFEEVGKCGYGLWDGKYIDFFKYENEKNKEMVFPLQFDESTGYCDNFQLMVGARDHYDCWSALMPSADFVDYYRNADGSEFKWSDFLPDWDKLTPAQREVFFLRDNLATVSSSAYKDAKSRVGASIMTKYYLSSGNEARLKRAYESRDPRLQQTVFTPYSTANCYSPYYNSGNPMLNKVLRWPYLKRGGNGGDMWHDKRVSGFYLYRKYNETEKGRLIDRQHCHCDFPLIRYTDVWLHYAEALNEVGRLDEAIAAVNKIRQRAGMGDLVKGGTGYNAVSDKDDMRERIRYERRVELCLEGVNYFDEIRWGTYKDTKFQGNYSGVKACWGNIVGSKWYWKEYMTVWPVPLVETQRNPNLERSEGWTY